jgi:hypothetical protein
VALTYSQLVTQTIQIHLKTLRDNFHTHNRVLERIMKKKEVQAGGRSILQPIKYAALTNAGSFDPYATYPITNNEKVTNAEFEWASYQASIQLFGYDIAVNQAGPQQILNMIKEEFMSAEESLADAVATDLFTGTAAPTLVGLQTAIDSTSTYGGVAVADAAVWAAQESAMATLDLTTMGTYMRLASDNKDEPNLIITTKTVVGLYEKQLTPIQIIANSVTGDSGFQMLKFHGADIYYDNNCPAGEMYMLNENYIRYKVMKGVDMTLREKVIPDNQWSQVQTILYMPVFWIDQRRRHAKLTGITA